MKIKFPPFGCFSWRYLSWAFVRSFMVSVERNLVQMWKEVEQDDDDETLVAILEGTKFSFIEWIHFHIEFMCACCTASFSRESWHFQMWLLPWHRINFTLAPTSATPSDVRCFVNRSKILYDLHNWSVSECLGREKINNQFQVVSQFWNRRRARHTSLAPFRRGILPMKKHDERDISKSSHQASRDKICIHTPEFKVEREKPQLNSALVMVCCFCEDEY